MSVMAREAILRSRVKVSVYTTAGAIRVIFFILRSVVADPISMLVVDVRCVAFDLFLDLHHCSMVTWWRAVRALLGRTGRRQCAEGNQCRHRGVLPVHDRDASANSSVRGVHEFVGGGSGLTCCLCRARRRAAPPPPLRVTIYSACVVHGRQRQPASAGQHEAITCAAVVLALLWE